MRRRDLAGTAPMSAMGQNRSFRAVSGTSAHPPIAEVPHRAAAGLLSHIIRPGAMPCLDFNSAAPNTGAGGTQVRTQFFGADAAFRPHVDPRPAHAAARDAVVNDTWLAACQDGRVLLL